MNKLLIFGYNRYMREAGQNLDIAKKRVEMLRGTPVLLRVNEGRNRINCYHGIIEEVYPSVFTFRIDDIDKVKTFSYNEVQTKNVMFLRPETVV